MINRKDPESAMEAIKIALKFIQFGMNQRILSFTAVSPNMLMFGSQLNELTDVKSKIKQLKELKKEKSNKYKETELEFLNNLISNLKILLKLYNKDYNKYVKIMKKSYDKNKYDIKYNSNDKVMYYVGDRNSHSRKLRRKWTGPFNVIKHINDNTVEIATAKENITMPVHISRLKKYFKRKNEFWPIKSYENLINNDKISDILNEEDIDNESI